LVVFIIKRMHYGFILFKFQQVIVYTLIFCKCYDDGLYYFEKLI
jgi:hypothetical protein